MVPTKHGIPSAIASDTSAQTCSAQIRLARQQHHQRHVCGDWEQHEQGAQKQHEQQEQECKQSAADLLVGPIGEHMHVVVDAGENLDHAARMWLDVLAGRAVEPDRPIYS